jgi:hypothetical protein
MHRNVQPSASLSVVMTNVNPIISLFDQVTRIKQRELRPSEAEAHLIRRTKLVRALLDYMDRQVEGVEGNVGLHRAVARIANAKFQASNEVEAVIAELRNRIFAIKQVMKSVLH